MLRRDQWIDGARKLDWDYRYVPERELFPAEAAGSPWLPAEAWRGFSEPFRTSYGEYVAQQSQKEAALQSVRDAVGRAEDLQKLDGGWRCGLKLHAATLPLAEFAAVIGNLRAARFGRDGAWRDAALLGALDELRHTQIPLALMHDLLRADAQYDWTLRFFHSDNWVAIAARHLVDELLLLADPIEFAVATHFVFETGFTNLQFVGLSSLAHAVGDKMFEKMVQSIQSDEARHAQIGRPVLRVLALHDKARAQRLLDKWFWRSWLLFAIVTGFTMDYFAPLGARAGSFKEFVEEWVVAQYLEQLAEFGLERPWYWETFRESLDHYHHMVYASAYSYRASVWFDFVLPGPDERAWLGSKYPGSWRKFDPIWQRVAARWGESDPGNDFAVHGSAIVSFCDLCQLVLCGGTPEKNSAVVVRRGDRKYVFCSEPCRWIFEQEPERYAAHKDVVKRVLAGEAPANLIALVRRYFGLDFADWGRDLRGGDYPFIARGAPR